MKLKLTTLSKLFLQLPVEIVNKIYYFTNPDYPYHSELKKIYRESLELYNDVVLQEFPEIYQLNSITTSHALDIYLQYFLLNYKYQCNLLTDPETLEKFYLVYPV
jgi:hypothetical protein